MSRVVHFEFPVDNPERACAFYQSVFGWSFHKWDGPEEYWLVSTGPDTQPGINGGFLIRRAPDHPVTTTISVEDLDATIASIQSAGGEIVVPKMEIPGVGHIAYFKDTEGVIVGAAQFLSQGG